jgi:transposase-like protein
MPQRKRTFSPEFKAKVALAAIREEGTLAQLTSKCNVNPNMVSKWKKQALQQMAASFDKKNTSLPLNSEEEIDKIYLSHPYYRSRRMIHVLKQEDIQISRHRVRRLMRLMGVQAIHPKPRTTLGNTENPYLLKNLTIDRPTQVWCGDITYVPMKRGFMYLTAIID